MQIDLKQTLKHLYTPTAKAVQLVDVPPMPFLQVDGHIEPGEAPGTSAAFSAAIGALYGVAYTLKFACKKEPSNPIDYPVMALEGLWSADSGAFDPLRKDSLAWTLMIVQPDLITPVMFAGAVAQVKAKHPETSYDGVRLAVFEEGLSVQILHVGPYDTEPATIQRLHDRAHEQGYALRGRHHEIYLGDPRRCAPDRLRTILRQPVVKNA